MAIVGSKIVANPISSAVQSRGSFEKRKRGCCFLVTVVIVLGEFMGRDHIADPWTHDIMGNNAYESLLALLLDEL